MNFPVQFTKSKDGIIGTLHYYDEKRIVINGTDGISVERGVIPSIIHQYDRFPELSQHYATIY
jgi:hypothetical protein